MGKKGKTKINVILTDNDKAIVRFIGGKYGWVTTKALRETFWPGRSEQTFRERISRLVKSGYLGTMLTSARAKTERIYWIKSKVLRAEEHGIRVFSSEERKTFIKGQPPLGEISHMLEIGEWVEYQKKHNAITAYEHERKLRSEGKGGVIPYPGDARMQFNGVPMLLEMGSPFYTGKRLKSKIEDLGNTGMIVVWVEKTEKRCQRVAREAARYPNIKVRMFYDPKPLC